MGNGCFEKFFSAKQIAAVKAHGFSEGCKSAHNIHNYKYLISTEIPFLSLKNQELERKWEF